MVEPDNLEERSVSDTTTPKRNEAVAVDRYHLTAAYGCAVMEEHPDGDYVSYTDYVSDLSALQGEVSRLRAASEADSAYLRHLISAISAFKGKRGAFMALGAQDARTVRLWELLNNLEPPTDGR